jgi:hypothetical protein
MKRNFILFVVVLVIYFIAGGSKIEAATYYIDGVNGNDKNPGNFDLPWKTIAKANATLQETDIVYVRGGIYKHQRILPFNSGSAGKYITYQNYKDEKVILDGHRVPIYLNNKDYIRIVGFTIQNCTRFFVILEGADHNVIENCIFLNARGYIGGFISKFYINPDTGIKDKSKPNNTSNNYNKLINNEFKDAPDECSDGLDQDCGTSPSDIIFVEHGSYNLFQGNIFGNSAHDNLVFAGTSTHHNIIRRNVFRNTYRRGLDMYHGTNRNLVEENSFYDHGFNMIENPRKVSRNHEPWEAGAIQCIKGSNNMIIRKNLFHNNGHVLGGVGQNMHFYSNSADKQIVTVIEGGGSYDFKHNFFKNNVFSNIKSISRPNDQKYVYSWIVYVQKGYAIEDNIITHNVFNGDNDRWRYGRYMLMTSLEEFEAKIKEAFNNMTYIPAYMDSQNLNFNLMPTSKLIDSGTWLTIITSQSGRLKKYFTVKDAGYFTDGWGIPNETGDLIKTATGKKTRIVNINYESNLITVDPPVDIIQGEGLALNYFGAGPDIGAFEFQHNRNPIIQPPKKLHMKKLQPDK